MVAVVSGSGLGLFNSSTSSLGGGGANGDPTVGRGRDRVYVNSSTGNLIVQGVDETLTALGLDFAGVRTYNSQGVTDEDNNDQWRLGVQQRVYNLVGTVNTAGSKITKVFGDGSEVVYTWNTTRSRYESGDGDGANDFMAWNATSSTWTWTDGSARSTEEYGLVNGVHRIKFSRDADLNTVTYVYANPNNANLLSSIQMAGSTAQTVYFDYNGATTNLGSIRVVSNGVTQTLTRYGYDTSNRLQTVTVDLTPSDNSVTDNVTYTTTYTYEGSSTRIQSITQKDGSSVTFSYLNQDGGYRLWTVTDADGRITTFTYNNVTGTGGTQATATANSGQISNQDTSNVPYAINLNTLVRNEQQTTYTPYNLNTGPLTTPGGSSWGTASALEAEPSGSTASAPQVAFDSNGNGFAVWTVAASGANTLKVAQYTRSTNTWAAPVTLYTHASNVPTASLAVDAGGNAIIAWYAGGAISVSRYTGSWSAATSIVASGASLAPKVAISGTRAAIIWAEGSALTRSAYVSRWTGSAWTSKTTVDNQSMGVSELQVAVDDLGNVIAGWTQIYGSNTESCVWSNQYRVSSGTWTGAVTRDPLNPAALSPQVALDANGNGFYSFYQDNEVQVIRYTRSNNTWSSATIVDNLSGAVSQTSLAVDPSGNAVLAWVQVGGGANSVYAKVYNASTSTWSSVSTLESLTTAATAGSLRTSMRGSFATAVWVQNDGTRDNTYAATFNGTSWSSATVIETSTQTPSAPSIAIDSSGNATAIWIQSNGTAPSVYVNRFSSGGGGASYYLVPASATWQSIANTLYGINSAAAGTALQNAMPVGTSIAEGSQLLQSNLPNPLQVPSTTTVPDYYLIPGTPSTPTWRSIAAVVYGIDSASAGTVLQNLMQATYPTLSVGLKISGLPSSITVPTTVTLPYYYHVVQSSSWATTLQTIYGVSDPGLIEAVKAYSGVNTATLTVGTRLNVLQSQAYTVGGGSSGTAIYQRTTIAAPDTPMEYDNDAQGRLVAVRRGSGANQVETRYGYDSVTGNVNKITEDATGLNRITDFAYDANTGLLRFTRDSLGNTVERTYDPTNNQLLTEIRYTAPDPDAINTGSSPSGALTTRYAYDSESHLRFVISADGRVTEHQYNAAGQRVLTFNHLTLLYPAASAFTEADVQNIVGGIGAGVRERIDYTYDWRGNLQTLTRWAATTPAGAGTGPSSITQFVYDQRGQLLQTIDARGTAASVVADGVTNTLAYSKTFVYDGLGRLKTSVEWLKAADADGPQRTRTTSTVYDDVNRRTTVTLDNGLTTISNYNRAGALINADSGALGVTRYAYDAAGRLRIITDSEPTPVRQFMFYDDAGRLIGQVDGDGTVTEFVYDKASQVIKTVRYSVLLTASRLASLVDGSGNPTLIPFSTLKSEAGTSANTDQVSRNVYDNAGRLLYKIDTIGIDPTLGTPIDAVTKFVYDGANRLVEEVQYKTTISIARGTDQVLPSAVVTSGNAEDRRTRHFYDASDNRVATLDAAGYLTEFTYDVGGHLITEFEHANQVSSDYWLTGTLLQLQTSAGTDTTSTTDDTETDIHTYFYYDGQGRVTGHLDGEGFYTKTNYDVAGNVTGIVRYDRGLTYSSRPTQLTVEADVLGAAAHATARQYDGAGRLIREINFEGTTTKYEYDGLDHLLSEKRAEGDAIDERWTSTRYDLLGRVERELTAEGRVALTALGASPTQTAIDDVWNRFGVLYTYDKGGRRTSATHRPDDVQTNVTLYFYDDDGRVRFEVNQRGERKEYRYNALGQLTDEVAYYNRISTSGLAGGLLQSLTQAQRDTLVSLTDSARDTKTTHAYTLTGDLKSSITLEGASVTQVYNRFGELESRTVGAGGEGVATSFTYTKRGELKQTSRNGVLFETREYDAFGRVWKVTDGRGKVSKYEFDRLGRQLASIDELTGRSTTTYDGYSRIKTTDDATTGSNLTSYNYDDVARTMRVDTPEGVRIVTTHNRHDQTTTVTVGTTTSTINTKSFTYDKNGQVLFAYEGGVQIEAKTYDRGGRQVTQVDGRGTTTTIAYDTANRLFTSTVDSPTGGLRRQTKYEYDGIGRIYEVTDPTGTVTRTTYDRASRISEVAVDPTGLNLRTGYTYNTRNDTVTVTEMVGSSLPRRTQYLFDSLGRRKEEIVDPTSLGGTLNLRTQYKYDNNDNLTRKIDSRGFSTWYVYDDKNRLTHEIDAMGGLTLTAYDAADRVISTRRCVVPISNANLTSLATIDSPATTDFTPITDALDQIDRTYYDKDGRAKYSINGVGTVTQRTFDSAGNVTRLRVYYTQLSSVPADTAAVDGAITTSVKDRVTWNAFDSRGRAEFSVNSMDGVVGSVQRFTYDGNGNVVASRVYATSRSVSLATDLATLQSWATTNADATYDQVTRFWFDKADRQRFVLDAEGYVTETEYNDTTRASTTIAYATRQTGIVALGASSTDVDANSALLFDSLKDQTAYRWSDAAGRGRFVLDAEGYLTETRYNDTTGAVATIAYARKPSALTAASALSTVNGAILTTAGRDRTNLLWIDAAGRERFRMDAEGFAVETRYDDVTGTRRVIKYAQSVYNSTPPVTPPTLASAFTDVNTAITGLVNTNDQTTRTDLDKAGRVSSVTQAEGSVDVATEYYQYDAAGDKTKFTNAKGGSSGAAAYTWDYAYDAAGNLVTETTPPVDVYSVTASPTALTVGGATNQRIVTKFVYDHLGNVTHRYEAFGTGQVRLTRYEYDSLGRQLRTFYPPIAVYDAANDTSNLWGIGGTISPVETAPQDLYTEITYDALGNAFRSRDAAGNYSFKTYDRLGQVEYEIDPIPEGNTDPNVKNYVSRHQYDAFGNETTLTRYATGLSARPSITAVTLRAANFTVTTTGDDRVMTTTWDRRNLKTSVTLASLTNNYRRAPGTLSGTTFTGAGTTSSKYNAFGEVELSRVLVETDVLQDTYSYYDRRGLKVAEVDPLKYLTKFEYDSTGDLKRQIEYARPVTVAFDTTAPPTEVATPTSLGLGAAGTEQGFDREIIFGYDRLNRRTSQREVNVEQYSVDSSGNLSSATNPFADVTTSYAFDVLGNQICVTDAAGNKTWTYYDVLGRTIAVIEPVRDLGNGAASVNTINRASGSQRLPVTRYLLDAVGNTLQQIQYYKAIPDGTVPTATLPTTFDVDANDRITTMKYDNQGHVIRSEDPIGADRYASYGANGLVMKEWQVVTNALNTGTVTDTLVTLHKYDALGNETETQTPITHVGGTLIKTGRTTYNAFGDVKTRGTVDATYAPNGDQEYFDYDAAGRVWRTNSGDGVTKVLQYDLAGNVTRELRAQGIDLKTGALLAGGSVTLNNLQDVLNRLGASVTTDVFMLTETVYDAKGNVLEKYTPSYTINGSTLPQAVNDPQVGVVSGSPTPGAVYLHWSGSELSSVARTFSYRRVGDTAWSTAPIVGLPGDRLGVDITQLRNANYEYSVRYMRTSQSSSYAASTGTFRVDIPTVVGFTGVTRDSFTDADSVGNLSVVVPPTGTATGVVYSSATYSSPSGGSAPGGNPPRWFGGNAFQVNWTSTGGQNVAVEVEWDSMFRSGSRGPAGTTWRILTSNASSATKSWTESDVGAASGGDLQAAFGGLYSITRIRVYSIDGNGQNVALLRDSNASAAASGLTWTAPTDTGVTAKFFYKSISVSNYTLNADAVRVGSLFTVPVFSLLATAGQYDYRIEYYRGGVTIAAKEGRITSGGGSISTTGGITVTSWTPFNELVAPPSISGLTMSWNAPGVLNVPNSPNSVIERTFEYGPNTSYGSMLSITAGSQWSVALNSLVPGSGTANYAYRIRYKVDGRIVSEQTGTFSLVAGTTTVSWSTSVASDTPPALAEGVGTLTGTSSVLQATSARMSTATYSSPPGGSAPGGNPPRWWGGNAVLINWISTGGQSVRVVMDWDSTFRGGARGPAGAQKSIVTTAASQASISWAESEAGSASGGNDQASIGGLWGATRIRIYGLDAQGSYTVLLRDSQSSATVPGPVGINWAAPTDSSLTYKFFYNVSGSGSPIERAITRSGNTLSVDLAGVAAATYDYKIEYYRPGESGAIVNKTGTFTADGNSVTVNSQTPGNFEPSWLSVAPSGSTVLWNRPVNPGESLAFEYWNGSSWIAKSYSSGNNITYTSDFANFGAGTYSFRIRYRNSIGALQAQWSGQITVGSTSSSTQPYGVFGTQTGWNDATDPVSITTTVTDNVFRWSYPRGSSSDLVRFIYTLNGTTTTVDPTGPGPDFAVTLSNLQIGANNFTWSVEYTRPWNYESNAYAAAYGSASITRTALAPSTITVDTQQNVFPSPLQISAPENAGGGFLGWATQPDGNAAISFSYTPSGGTKTTVTTGFVAYGNGRKLDLSGLAAGTYRYSIQYTHSGEPTAYAKADGYFTITKTDGAASGSATVGAAYPETLALMGVAIQPRPLTNPPEAVWARRDWTTPPMYIPSVEAITSPGYGGGFIQDAPPSTAFPKGQYHQVSPASAYTMYNGLVFAWTPSTALDTRITFEYRPKDSTGAYTSINVYRLVGYTQVGAEVTNLALGDYEFRVTYTLTGSSTPFSTATGFFNRTADIMSHVISVNPATVPEMVTARPVLKQSVDRWGNSTLVQDAAGNITEYRFDQHNQQVQVTAPLVDYLDTRSNFTDATTSDRPKTYAYFDKLGRQVASRDANGNLMRYYYNAAGQVVTTQNADSGDHAIGSFQRNEYDTFGQVIQSSDELTSGILAAHTDNLGFKTRNFYDKGGRLTDVWREIYDNAMPAWGTATAPSTVQTISYGYDENNRRIREVNGAGEVTRYAYDLAGNVTLRRTPGLNDTRYTYNVHGAKATEEVDVYTGGVFTRQTWTNDYFGRVRGHVGWTLFNGGANAVYFGTGTGATYNYSYNMAGLLYLQTSNEGQRVEYTFDGAGQTTEIRDIGVNRQTYITYDTYGRRQRERVFVDGLIHQDTKTTYDAMGRISFVEDPDYRLSYRYDLAGNRTLIHDEFVNHYASRTVEDLYFTYDKMNRVKVGQGVKTAVPATSPVQYQVTMSGNIGGPQGFIYTYNARGDRTSTTQHDLTWQLSGTTWSEVRASANPNVEKYTYDGLGRLTDVERKTNTGTGFALYRHNVYDNANRVTSETNYFIEDSKIANRTTSTLYDSEGRASTQTTRKAGEYESIMSFGSATLSGGVWSAGYDKAGNLRGFTAKQFDHGHQNLSSPLITTENRFTYELGETFMISYESARSSSSHIPQNQLPKNGDVYRTYNVNEELVKARDTATLSKSRGYVNNQQGQVLTSVQTDVTSTTQFNAAMDAAVAHASQNGQNNGPKGQYTFYFNGLMLGTFGQLQPNALGDYKGNFDVNYTPISAEYPMSTPPTVVALKGDTLRIIAARIYGDASLWYILADENALTSPDEVIPEGTALRVPNDVVSLANSANVYKPYDAAKAIGDLSPSQPIPPPPKQNCNMLAMVLIIIVMVVVTIFTAGAAAAAMAPALGGSFSAVMGAGAAAMAGTASGLTAIGSMVAAGIGAAVGSIVSQGLGMALGVQDKFSWKAVATSALSAGIGAGIGAAGTAINGLKTFATAHPYLYAAASAATGSALTQGVSVAVKLQDKFSWREVAVSAVTAGITEAAGNYAGSRMNNTSMKLFRTGQAVRGPLTNFGTGIVKGYTSAAVRAAFGGKFDMVQVTADVFGHAIGNQIVEGVTNFHKSTAPESAAPEVPRHPMPELTPIGKDEILKMPDTILADLNASMGTPNFDTSYVAQSGDSISKILGTSNPEAIGAFMRLNGLTSSKIFAGQTYELPQGDYAKEDARLGQTALNADNARIAKADAPVVSFPIEVCRIPAPPAPQNYVYGVTRPNGEMRGIGAIEGFFTFNRFGQALNGLAHGANDLIRTPVTLSEGISNLLSDAYGYSKDAIFGPEKSPLLGDELPYQAQSGIVRHFQQGGGVDLGAMGRTLPVLAQFDAINRNDMYGLGYSLPSTALALEGGTLTRSLGAVGIPVQSAQEIATLRAGYIRSNVLENVAETRAGNLASNFSTHATNDALIIEALASKQSPWPLGYTPQVRAMAIGEQFSMVIDEFQASGLRGPGGFGTPAGIPDLDFARNQLAITDEFKRPDLMLYSQRYEVVKPFNSLSGPVGPQIDQVSGFLRPGNKFLEQWQLQLAPTARTQYIKPVGPPRQLQ